MAETAVCEHFVGDTAGWVRLLLEEAYVFGNLFLALKSERERADADANELILHQIPCIARQWFRQFVAVTPAVVRFLPDSCHIEESRTRTSECQLLKIAISLIDPENRGPRRQTGEQTAQACAIA